MVWVITCIRIDKVYDDDGNGNVFDLEAYALIILGG
jgi:hypothetical protein